MPLSVLQCRYRPVRNICKVHGKFGLATESRPLLWCFPIGILKEVQSCSVVSPGIEAAACSQRPLIKMIGAEFLLFVFSELFIFLLNL